eukprot:SAG11_NODE_26178_length_348_cov_2.546185_1_plen_38_part_10
MIVNPDGHFHPSPYEFVLIVGADTEPDATHRRHGDSTT